MTDYDIDRCKPSFVGGLINKAIGIGVIGGVIFLGYHLYNTCKDGVDALEKDRSRNSRLEFKFKGE